MGEGDRLQLVSEPEAAAMYALQQMRGDQLVIGDTFILFDAGGGTVDLISYKIEQLAKKMRIVEVARGDGGQCGFTFLDRRFKAYLRAKLGQHRAWNEDMLEEVSLSQRRSSHPFEPANVIVGREAIRERGASKLTVLVIPSSPFRHRQNASMMGV